MRLTDAADSGPGDLSSARSSWHRRVTTGWFGVRRIESGARVLPKPAPSSHAGYVGRVGALAVALGIGAAIASVPAVAFADTAGSGGGDGFLVFVGFRFVGFERIVGFGRFVDWFRVAGFR